MSDEHLSGEEKRAKMKEEFKKELRARKEFQDKVKHLRQTQRINEALSNMSVEDDTDEWVNKLNEETAFMEAKSELAMDTAGTINVPIEGPDGDVDAQVADTTASDEELRKLAAEELVRQMKAEMAAEQGESLESPLDAPVSSPLDRVPATDSPSDASGSEDSVLNQGEENTLEDVDRPFRKMIDDID